MARVVKRHLNVPITSDEYDAGSSSSTPFLDTESQITPSEELNPYNYPGGAIASDIYKWTNDVEGKHKRRNRSQSLQGARTIDPVLTTLRAPGGFRRHYVLTRAKRQGKQPPNFITKSFIDFLAMYGHFAGEDLSDDEGDLDEDDIEGLPAVIESRLSLRRDRNKHPSEQTALLHKRASVHTESQGTASVQKAVFLLLKSFVGTGVIFLGKAFFNGGMLFSIIVLTLVAAVSLYSFLLLVETRTHVPASFGDIGGILYGPVMRFAVLFSIAISQMGFVCAYMVFVSQNIQALVHTLTDYKVDLSYTILILSQCFFFVPMSMIRRIEKLSIFALIADVFIMFGLLYIYYYDLTTLAANGPSKVALFNPESWALFFGTAIFTYEGISLIIPISEAMREPEKFPAVLSGTMLGITVLFASVGALCYLTFGDNIQTNVLLNLPEKSPIVGTVQALYSLAILLSVPLQLFPAVRIVETGLFTTRSGKNNPTVKWQKNFSRFFIVMTCATIAKFGSSDLDKFVSLTGSLACIPLSIIWPPLFHLKAIARKRWEIVVDLALVMFGIVCMIFTTSQTISQWVAE